MPSLLTNCAPKDPGPEIIYSGTVAVVGSGPAGLYVADILSSKGIKVKVFEARDQIGGRVRSLRNQTVDKYPLSPNISSDFPIELGAEVILGSDSIFGKILKDYNLQTAEFLPSSNYFVMEKVVKSDSEWGGDADYLAAKNFKNSLKNYAGNSQSVQEAIVSAGVGTRAHSMLNGQIGNSYGSTNEKIGIGALAEDEKLRVNDGKLIGLKTNPMQDILISRFFSIQAMVQLNTPIISINHGSDPVVLTAKDGSTYTADKVVVTVPVSVLKNGSLSFSPGLSGEFAGSLSKLGMGASYRAIIEFKKNFWGETTGFIFGAANVPEYFGVGLGRSQFNSTLSVTVNGDKANQFSSLGDKAAIDAILAELDELFAGQATKFIRKVIVKGVETDYIFIIQDWSKMDYIQGGFSYPLPGATNNDRKAIGKPANDKLFFAGEATDITGQAGMVNGALASAERAAQEVIAAINKA